MTERRRRPWLAALLSFTGGPVGHVYAGALRRCMCLWSIGIAVTLVGFLCGLCFPVVRPGYVVLVMCAIGYPFFVAFDAFRTASRNRDKKLRPYQRWLVYLVFALAFTAFNNGFALLLRWQLAEAFVIPTRAMSDTVLPGDKILVDKRHFRFSELQHGDVVVFFSAGPGSPPWIQRVIGLPGDEIEIRDEDVYVNGAQLDEPYVKIEGSLPPYVELSTFAPRRVPDNHVFLLGDNRRMSKDSRIIGFIPTSDIIGLARLVYWSRERHFPDPYDTKHYLHGRVRWQRFGMPIQ